MKLENEIMAEFEDMSEKPFEEWCNYRTLVSKMIVANMGGGLGFNLYFVFPETELTTDKRCFGVRLGSEQLESLETLIRNAFTGKDSDDRSMDGGVYSDPPDIAADDLSVPPDSAPICCISIMGKAIPLALKPNPSGGSGDAK